MADKARPAPPPTPLLYLDVDDEITSAAARIRFAEADHVALVLPYGSRLATSRINFRLLAREAEERGKHIEIVSADSSARALATAAGLSVHASVAAFEGHRSGVGGESTAEAAGGAATSGGRNDTEANVGDETGAPVVGSETIAAPGSAKAPVGGLSVEDDTRTKVLEQPRRRSQRVPVVGPPRPPMRTGLAIGLGLAIVVLVAASGLLALELLPTASIVLAPRSEPVGPVALSVEARLDATGADPVALVVPAQRVPFQLQAVETVQATGVNVTETAATGSVTFSNFDTGGGVVIPASTLVRTESDIEFRTLAEVTLPRARFDFFPPFPVHPSTSSVGVEALLPGVEGNVGNNTITEIPRSRNTLTVTNPEATTGGSRTETPEVSQADVDAAIAGLATALAAELDRQVAEGLGVPPGVTTFEGTEVVGEPEYATDPATLVGGTSPIPLAAMAEGSVLGVDPTPIESIAGARLQARVTEGWSLAPGSIAFELDTPSVFGDTVTYSVSVSATQVHDVDQGALLAQVRGLMVGDARSRLDDFGDVEITVWPDWVTTIPKNQERISFTLAEPRPAPSPTPVPSP